MVTQAMECTELALAFLQNLSLMNKLKAGRLEQRPSPTSLSAIVSKVEQVLSPQMADGVEFRLQCDELEPLPDVTCDGSLLTHVLINLCQNAARFTTSGSVSLMATVQMISESSSTRILKQEYDEMTGKYGITFSVCDTGPGIPPSMMSKLFSRYTSNGGLGIGLHLCNQLVRSFGSKLEVTSPCMVDETGLAFGANFTFTLVCCRAESRPTSSESDSTGRARSSDPEVGQGTLDNSNKVEARPRQEQPREQTHEEMLELIRGRRVVIADDVKSNRVLLRHVFVNVYGCDVLAVSTAEEVHVES